MEFVYIEELVPEDHLLRKMVRLSHPGTVMLMPICSSVPIDRWETKNLTLMGDAIHSMTPLRGIGANIALE
jgi:salicylate hydroxylase